ncbi:type I-E CRISPR-associated protein Cas7/Cse4/CasC [Olsenella uli]
MSKPLFVDVHILQSVPPSNINRDDTGSPKTARFGGATRARVSSQAWKKATRDLFPMYVDSSQLGERTKYAVQLIADRAMELDEDLQEEGALKAAKEVLSKYCEVPSKKKLSFEREDKNKLKTLIFLSQAEIEQLAQCVVGNEQVKNLKGKDLTRDALDVAMFGRMVATKPELNIDAAVQVAHAISVGRAETEFDYFTALDDRAPEDNAGAAMIETTEFTSSTLYRYADIDVLHLCENLGSAEAACKGVEAFLRAFALSMPTGKQNSFANRTLPAAIVVELRETQPVSLVNAFEKPVSATAEKSQVERACEELVVQEFALDEAFGIAPKEVFVVVASPYASTLKEFPNAIVTDFDDLVSRVSEACAAYLAESGYPSESGE